jgi:hypothetical protein
MKIIFFLFIMFLLLGCSPEYLYTKEDFIINFSVDNLTANITNINDNVTLENTNIINDTNT